VSTFLSFDKLHRDKVPVFIGFNASKTALKKVPDFATVAITSRRRGGKMPIADCRLAIWNQRRLTPATTKI